MPHLYAQNPRQPGQLAGTPVLPLSTADKLKYRGMEIVDPEVLTGTAIAASIEQMGHTPVEWHQGVEGYAKRYASTYAGVIVRESLNFGFEAVLKEDPRYFALDGASKSNRFWHALKQTFIAHTDSGGETFAYGRVASAFATGQISRAWLPRSENKLGDGFETGGISLGVDAAVNLLYEFVPSTRPK